MDSRASTLLFSLALVLAGCKSNSPIHLGTAPLLNESLRPFYHGVASGDPRSDRVIIWTRLTPDEFEPTAVGWRVALDSSFQNTIQAGAVTALPEEDFTVKIDVTGLKSNTQYYYRFFQENLQSVTGRTRTLPALGNRPVNLAVVGSNNYETGYFNVYQSISRRDELDAVVQIGNYMSADATSDAPQTTRRHLPETALATLDDYRIRYAQYRLDPQLRAAHKKHAFIYVWDDRTLPQTELESGPAAARQAYFEWLPIRERSDERLFNNFTFGSLADLHLLDQRTNEPDAQMTSPSGSQAVLGGKQLSWLTTQLLNSQSQWKLVAFKGLFSQVENDREFKNLIHPLDYWDYATAERKQLADSIITHKVKNVVFLSANAGGSWAFDINRISAPDKMKNYEARLAVEFATPDITPGAPDELTDELKNIEARMVSNKGNSQLKYVNLRDPGYLLLQMEFEKLSASWFYVDRTDSVPAAETLGMKCELTEKGQLSVREATLMTRARK